METTIEEVIQKLKNKINEAYEQIELIKSLKLTDIINEKEWYEICETGLRNSDIMAILLSNIFPHAKDIEVSYNYVYFNLYGFMCALPTSRCYGIEIDTTWYKERNERLGEESLCYYGNDINMKKYFEALDSGQSWDILFKYRVGRSYYRKYVRFILWFCVYRWKDDKRSYWEQEFKKCEEKYEQRVADYNETRKEIKEKTLLMKDKLIPELNKFTNRIGEYKDRYSIEEIFKLENI